MEREPHSNPASRTQAASQVDATLWKAFADFLDARDIPPQTSRWYQTWLQRCLLFHSALSPQQLSRQQSQAYLDGLRTQQTPDWQITQAQQAITQFYAFLDLTVPASQNTMAQNVETQSAVPSPVQNSVTAPLRAGRIQTSLNSPPRQPFPGQPALLARVQTELRVRRYALRTEDAYLHWIQRFLAFHAPQEPLAIGANGVRQFLEYLALERHVAAATQNQALNALTFLYREVLGESLILSEDMLRARRTKRLPVVLSAEETQLVLDALNGTYRLMAQLLYGTGLRLMECLRLRVKDLDFDQHLIVVRQGKGDKDRLTPLPKRIREELERHLVGVKRLHDQDLGNGAGEVYLPDALAVKYPRASREWNWQWVFPARSLSTDPRSGKVRRHHQEESGLQRAVTAAARQSGVTKPVSCHAFRHSFATRLLEKGYDIRTVQELLGHSYVSTTMIYTHVLNRPGLAVLSPLDDE